MAHSREVIKKLTSEGYILRPSKKGGDHRQYVKGNKLVTITHPVKDLAIGTLRSIYRQTGWDWSRRRDKGFPF